MPYTNTRKVALVVGASRGIGRQIAVDLARECYAGAQSSYHTLWTTL
jgi:NAD(P)-dependent dehydrogenase (short-subunit alcohol dehydrogenase family)